MNRTQGKWFAGLIGCWFLGTCFVAVAMGTPNSRAIPFAVFFIVLGIVCGIGLLAERYD